MTAFQSFVFLGKAVIGRRAIILPRPLLVFRRAAVRFQKPARPDIAGQTARGEGAAREAEKIDFRTLGIMLGEVSVGAAHVVAQHRSRQSADQSVDRGQAGPDPCVVIDALLISAGRRLDLWGDQIANPDDIGDLLAVGGVPGSIEAKDEASDHLSPLPEKCCLCWPRLWPVRIGAGRVGHPGQSVSRPLADDPPRRSAGLLRR